MTIFHISGIITHTAADFPLPLGSNAFHQKNSSYLTERDRLREALQNEIRKLGVHAGRHQIAKAVTGFRSEYASALEDQVQRGLELVAELKVAAQETVPEPISEFHKHYKEVVRERHSTRESYHKNLASALSEDEKEALRDSFREAQKNVASRTERLFENVSERNPKPF